ncbi:hypothetical protein JHK87_033904 [Glycine soja]|nr:hypothetical protein JHK87_033904 [Glycine soja]
MLMKSQKDVKKPKWMFDRVWNGLLAKWNLPKYRIKCLQAQKNQNSEKGGSLHIGGSLNTHKHAICMTRFSQARSKAESCGGSSDISPLDPAEEVRLRTQTFVVGASGFKKGWIYGTGELTHGYKCVDILTQMIHEGSSHSQDLEEIVQLKKEVCQSREDNE